MSNNTSTVAAALQQAAEVAKAEMQQVRRDYTDVYSAYVIAKAVANDAQSAVTNATSDLLCGFEEWFAGHNGGRLPQYGLQQLMPADVTHTPSPSPCSSRRGSLAPPHQPSNSAAALAISSGLVATVGGEAAAEMDEGEKFEYDEVRSSRVERVR